MGLRRIGQEWRSALANRDPRIIERLLRGDELLKSSETAELRGLLLLGGDGDVPFTAESAWDVPASVGTVRRGTSPAVAFGTTLGASIREDYEGEDLADYYETDEFVRAVNGEFDRHMHCCTCDSAAEAYFLDMDDRASDGLPRVALSSINGMSERPGTPFWDWVDEALPSLLFCH
ncbi:hypothetical protein Acsp03_62720 [Actinomadura sp. NBRC 104412]|uniref:hypothetical protein n=1 Tax=Actinomadura sp. NBRC 104412 TaxID=3032203 RepID=UPI0024A22B41|nr:hypothetical protein [Actinomadura sp. NBRC 104412]GLZ08806.1 hypothetical protein Acsp03_62720 [Actinomadura sp. NBRC 104412]